MRPRARSLKLLFGMELCGGVTIAGRGNLGQAPILCAKRRSCLPSLWNPCIQRGGRACSSVVEHLTFNQRVVGSYPTGLTNNFCWISILYKNCLSFRFSDYFSMGPYAGRRRG